VARPTKQFSRLSRTAAHHGGRTVASALALKAASQGVNGMSALGHKRTSDWDGVMSALLPKADMVSQRLERPLCAKSCPEQVQQKLY
jgi:hypothetical protein